MGVLGAETGEQDEPPIGFPIIFGILEKEDFRRLDHVAPAVHREHRRGNVEVVAEDSRLFRGALGFGLGGRSKLASINHWTQRLTEWLGDSGFLTKPGGN